MGLYTETILKRDETDRAREEAAEQSLVGSKSLGAGDKDGGAQRVVHYILARYGLHADEVYGCDTVESMMDLLLDPLGMMYDDVDLTDPSWKKRTDLMLGFMEDGEAVVLIPAGLGYVCYSFLTGQKKPVRKGTGLRDKAYAIYRPLPEEKITLFHLTRYMMQMVTPLDFIMIAAAALAITLLGTVVPSMNQRVLNEIVGLGNEGIPLLIKSMILFLFAGLVKALLSGLKGLFLGRMKERIAGQTEAAIMARLLLMPQSFFTASNTGKLSKKLSNTRRLCEQILGFILGSLLTTLFSFIYIRQMGGFSAVLLIPALIMLTLQTIFSLLSGLSQAQNERRSLEAETDSESFLIAAIKGVQTIKGCGAERRVFAKWADDYRLVLKYHLNPPLIIKLESVITGFLTSLTTVILLSLVLPNAISGANYIAFTSAYGLVTAAVTELVNSIRRIVMLKPMADSIQDLMNTHTEGSRGDIYLRDVKGAIRLEHVSFGYEDSQRGCLRDISLNIRSGEKIAIAGESGCGKSTLLKIILGTLQPDEGEVYIDGKSLKSVNVRSYRRRIGSVFQFSRVIPGTIYSNIMFNSVPVSREEAEIALEKAAIADYVDSLPMGMDTEISESASSGFSGGQRQRLLLARAFASHPAILILDEATSALDNITQAKVLESVYRERCTVIMVAHRLSTVTGCDRILMLENGRITEEGNFEQLMAENGAFARLVRKQQQSAWTEGEG